MGLTVLSLLHNYFLGLLHEKKSWRGKWKQIGLDLCKGIHLVTKATVVAWNYLNQNSLGYLKWCIYLVPVKLKLGLYSDLRRHNSRSDPLETLNLISVHTEILHLCVWKSSVQHWEPIYLFSQERQTSHKGDSSHIKIGIADKWAESMYGYLFLYHLLWEIKNLPTRYINFGHMNQGPAIATDTCGFSITLPTMSQLLLKSDHGTFYDQ